MSNIIVVNGVYNDDEALKSVLNYGYEKNISWNGVGVRTTSMDEAVKSMEYVKEFWEQTDGKRLCHIVINLGGTGNSYIDCVAEYMADEIAALVADFIYSRGYQNCYFKHVSDSGVLHFHFVINNVHILDGRKIGSHSELASDIHRYLLHNYPGLDWRGVSYHQDCYIY